MGRRFRYWCFQWDTITTNNPSGSGSRTVWTTKRASLTRCSFCSPSSQPSDASRHPPFRGNAAPLAFRRRLCPPIAAQSDVPTSRPLMRPSLLRSSKCGEFCGVLRFCVAPNPNDNICIVQYKYCIYICKNNVI